MDFEDALQRTAPLQRVGELRLRYETSLLIAEPPEPPKDARLLLVRLTATALLGLAFASVVGGAEGKTSGAALALLLFGAGLLVAAPRLFPRPQARRFILNFATESLRIDDLGARPRTRVLRFDDVAQLEVEVEPDAPGRFQLVLTARTSPSRELLLRGVPADEVEELRRLWRVLSDAFGLRRSGVEL